MTTPTPEQFLAAPPDPDEEPEQESPASFGPGGCDVTTGSERLFVLPPNPLESIAESLRELVALAHPADKADPEGVVTREEFDELARAYDDLGAKHDTLRALVTEIEGIVKKSTSKVSLEVKDAVERWKNPQVPESEPEDAERLQPPPAPGAPVEEWRAYAHERGYPEGTVVDNMNRSQIRTMLGIEQPVAGEGAGESA